MCIFRHTHIYTEAISSIPPHLSGLYDRNLLLLVLVRLSYLLVRVAGRLKDTNDFHRLGRRGSVVALTSLNVFMLWEVIIFCSVLDIFLYGIWESPMPVTVYLGVLL